MIEKCLICGKEFQRLAAHMTKTHGGWRDKSTGLPTSVTVKVPKVKKSKLVRALEKVLAFGDKVDLGLQEEIKAVLLNQP